MKKLLLIVSTTLVCLVPLYAHADGEVAKGYEILSNDSLTKSLIHVVPEKEIPSYCRDKVISLIPYKENLESLGLGNGKEVNFSYYDYCVTSNKLFSAIKNNANDIRRLLHIVPLFTDGIYTGVFANGRELIDYSQRQNSMVFSVGYFKNIDESKILASVPLIKYSALTAHKLKDPPQKYINFMRALFTRDHKTAIKIVREQPISNWGWDDYPVKDLSTEGKTSVLSVCKTIRDDPKRYSLEYLVNLLGIPNVQNAEENKKGIASVAWMNGLRAEYEKKSFTVQECPLHKLEIPADGRFDDTCNLLSQVTSVEGVEKILGDPLSISGGRDIVSGGGFETLSWGKGFSIIVSGDKVVSMPCKK